jgi:20S proteasome subunit alpha 4
MWANCVGLVWVGLTADARVLIDKARRQSQSYQLSYEDKPSVEFIAQFIAKTQQKYTQSGGVRPFGISTLVSGFEDGAPHLFLTEPSGVISEWTVCISPLLPLSLTCTHMYIYI